MFFKLIAPFERSAKGLDEMHATAFEASKNAKCEVPGRMVPEECKSTHSNTCDIFKNDAKSEILVAPFRRSVRGHLTKYAKVTKKCQV